LLLAFRRFDAEDQHVLGQPAGAALLGFLVTHVRGDAQREALLAQQRIAAVARTEGPDLAGFRIVHDVLGGVARPAHVLLAGGQRHADGVHAGHELAVAAQHVVHGLAHARHDAHVDGHIRRIGQFDADVGDRRTQRTHRERHHVHRAAGHAAVEQAVQGGRISSGSTQLLVGPACSLVPEQMKVRSSTRATSLGSEQRQVGIRALGRVQALHGAGLDHLRAQAVVLFLRAVAPVDGVGLGQGGNVGHPIDEFLCLM
jgi:hypothetical protein